MNAPVGPATLRGARLIPGAMPSAVDVLGPASVHCVVTSPPYLWQRRYGVAVDWPSVRYRPRFDLPAVDVAPAHVELGWERSLVDYVGHLVLVGRALARVIRPDGTWWLNLAACFGTGSQRKQLLDVPAAVADALAADGWIVRNRIIWRKPNPRPDSTRDRCTPSYETVYVLARGAAYYFDDFAIATPAVARRSGNRTRKFGSERDDQGDHHGASIPWSGDTAHPRDVWTVAVEPFVGAHFAVMPEELARRCILVGTSAQGCCRDCGSPRVRVFERGTPAPVPRGRDTARTFREGSSVRDAGHASELGAQSVPRRHVGWRSSCACPESPAVPCIVLDPFGGAGTTARAARSLGRDAVLVEPQPAYHPLIAARLGALDPLFHHARSTP